MLITPVYNPAVYYTTEELQANGKHINAEAVVERPHLYLFARPGSSLDA